MLENYNSTAMDVYMNMSYQLGVDWNIVVPKLEKYVLYDTSKRTLHKNDPLQAGLEAGFQVPMPGDSGLSPDAGSISNYCLTQEIFTPTPADCCPSIGLKQCFGQ